METKSTVGGTPDVMGDIDDASSLEQVAGAKKDYGVIVGSIDEANHGGINQTVEVPAGAAPGTTMTTYNCSAPTPEEMGIN